MTAPLSRPSRPTTIPIAAISFATILSATTFIATPWPARAASPVEPARAEVEALVREQGVPGMAVAVSRRGETLWSEAFGVLDRNGAVPVDRETLFRIGSVSKALTSVALGRLLERGVVALDDSPRDALPELPPDYGVMSLRQVAGHLAGIAHYRGVDFVNREHYDSARAAVAKFVDRELVAAAGERFAYSSYGWNLLGAVLEARTGKRFVEIVQAEVLEPFGLERTRLETAGETAPNRASNYGVMGGTVIDAPEIDNSDAYPSAGFLSTADELARFGWLVLSDAVLGPETRQTLWTEQHADDGTPTGYGLGWQWRDLAGHRAVGHGGSHVGATAGLWIVPDDQLVVALVASSNVEGFAELEATLVELFATR